MVRQQRTSRDRLVCARAFTLLELIVVLVILAVLAAVAAVGHNTAIHSGQQVEAKASVASAAKFVRSSLVTGGITGADGTVSPTLSSSVGTMNKDGAAVYVDETAQTFCVSKTAEDGTIYAFNSSTASVYESEAACISAATTPAAASGGSAQPVEPSGSTGTLVLAAGDFQTRVANPYNGSSGPNTSWSGSALTMTNSGMVLSNPGGPSLANGSVSANIMLGPTSNGAGIVFRAKQEANGTLSGFVYQIDPGYLTNGQPTLLVRQWTAGSENWKPVMRVQLPAGVDVRATNNLKLDLNGDNFVAYLNGNQIGNGTLPSGYTGTQVGARTWNQSVNTIDKISVTHWG